MTLVIDASVAVKFFFPESGHDQATAILESAEPIIAPDLIIPELLNVLWKKGARGEVSPHQTSEIVADLPMTFPTIIPSVDVAGEALLLAGRLRHPVYDCLYLATALASGATLVTADESFADKVRAAGLGSVVLDLSDWSEARADPLLPRTDLREEVQRLSLLVERTFEGLSESARGSTDPETIAFISMEAVAPAFDSPAYRRLTQLIDSLSGEEVASLVALAWLGRREEHDDLRLHVERARLMLGNDRRQRTTYVISILPTVAAGYERYKRLSGSEATH